MITKNFYYKGKTLTAPDSYWVMSIIRRNKISNGCGPKGWKGNLVPETMYGKNVSDACHIHDYMYHVGKTIEDKKKADVTFYKNLLIIVDGSWYNILVYLRRFRAKTYYKAVSVAGEKHFLKGKEGIK